mgnify:CR=1 FL=1
MVKIKAEKKKLRFNVSVDKNLPDNLTGDDIQEGMYIVFNLTAPNVSYDAQVKSTITKIGFIAFNASSISSSFVVHKSSIPSQLMFNLSARFLICAPDSSPET